uniref:Uncharacterized protein n=1 Tax=Setaria digitata TaxID=48799 RepID=A0A915PUC7_9BILA
MLEEIREVRDVSLLAASLFCMRRMIDCIPASGIASTVLLLLPRTFYSVIIGFDAHAFAVDEEMQLDVLINILYKLFWIVGCNPDKGP